MSLLKKLFGQNAGATYVRRPVVQTDQERAQAELQRDIALAAVEENHPLWQAVLSLVDEHADNERASALASGLNDADRQFATGSAANADYLAIYLRDARRLAALRLAKVKQAE